MANSSDQKLFWGISNPFALTERKQGKQINWVKKTYEEKVDLLEDMFSTSYAKLFDPTKNSPLFTSYSAAADRDDHIIRVGAGGVCAIPAKYTDFTGMYYDTDSLPSVRDPVQGCIPNCWLVAAMASVAWILSSNATISGNQAASPFTFSFYANTAYLRQTTKPYLPVDSAGNLLYCRSSNQKDLWPSVCEKAYYQWRNIMVSNPVDPEKPDYCAYGAASPLTGIQHLTGKTTAIFDISADGKYSADSAFSKIDANSASYNRSSINKKIKTPAVAWTYDPANPPSTYRSVFGELPTYVNSTLPACHCFSILGTYTAGSTADKKYIVLRNPYGPPVGDPEVTGVLSTITFCDINMADKDGIFAIAATEFVKKFQGYGWAVG